MSSALIWLVIGFVLIVAEFFITSFIVIFFGIAAVLVGTAIWLGLPDDSAIPYLTFAALSVVLLFGLRSRFQDWFVGSLAEHPGDDDFLGHEVQIESGFDDASPGRGRVSYRGAGWNAKSDSAHLVAGSYATIIDRQSALLTIEPTEPPNDEDANG
ncbi:MAG: NfeD family protein [Pseudomonadota bacterium]